MAYSPDEIVTVCAWCKKRKLDVQGRVVYVESTVPEGAIVSHGICEECYEVECAKIKGSR